MATEAIKSASITKRDATPPVLADNRLNQAVVKHCRGVCTMTTGKDTASTYRFFEIPSTAVPVSLRISQPAIGSTATLNIGLYRTTADGGLVVDQDFFASAYDPASAHEKVEVMREAASLITVALSEKTIWELTGLYTVDPQCHFDVVAVATGAVNGSGAVLLEFDYTEQ